MIISKLIYLCLIQKQIKQLLFINKEDQSLQTISKPLKLNAKAKLLLLTLKVVNMLTL